MQFRTAVCALIPILAGLGCESSGPYTLIVHHDGLHLATVTYLYSFEVEDGTGGTYIDSGGKTVDLQAGQTLTRTISRLDTLTVEVVRQGDGAVVFRNLYEPEDFKGPENELKIVVRP